MHRLYIYIYIYRLSPIGSVRSVPMRIVISKKGVRRKLLHYYHEEFNIHPKQHLKDVRSSNPINTSML